MKTIGIIGLGLIGGSIAKTFRRVHPEFDIYAYNRSSEALANAHAEGVIDVACEENDPRFSECDVIFLCAPVEYNLAHLETLGKLLKPGAIITDVGSVKGVIHQKVNELGLEDRFIGGHPMAGSEHSGYEYATDRLLENAYYILTPGGEVSLDVLSAFNDLIASIGAIPMVLTCEEHDFAVAGISHLPHLIASSLVNLVKELDNDSQIMKMIAAGGFRDITRIASSSPEMWQQICEENQKNISAVLDAYIRMLVQIRCQVDEKNGGFIYQMFESSRNYRDSIDVDHQGMIGKAHVVFVDIADEAGGIAAIATILAMDGISIKNIGIIHNREFEQGVLKIEFYEKDSMERGLALLQKRNYITYVR
ncbi:MAG: prephenate dehydrogenase [Blautia sp.]|nr:prephenate dehydrogenase [Blautia sp.]